MCTPWPLKLFFLFWTDFGFGIKENWNSDNWERISVVKTSSEVAVCDCVWLENKIFCWCRCMWAVTTGYQTGCCFTCVTVITLLPIHPSKNWRGWNCNFFCKPCILLQLTTLLLVCVYSVLDIALVCLHSHLFAVRHATHRQRPAQGHALWQVCLLHK